MSHLELPHSWEALRNGKETARQAEEGDRDRDPTGRTPRQGMGGIDAGGFALWAKGDWGNGSEPRLLRKSEGLLRDSRIGIAVQDRKSRS
jgi:hypothetical protein